jgi:hypothetical protein
MGFRGQFAQQQSEAPHVRFGSLAEIEARPRNVRFTPESGHWKSAARCPLCAKSGHDSERQPHCSYPCTVTPRLAEYSFANGKRPPSSGAATVVNSAYVVCPPLGFGLNESLWFRWQLKNRSVLTLTQRCQQHDLPIRKFQRIVVRDDLVFVDLPKDRCLALDHIVVPRP